MTDERDELAEMLADGWEIAGYNQSMMALGATSDQILLRKGTSVAVFTLLVNGGKELGRGVKMISPKPATEPKKGFFG